MLNSLYELGKLWIDKENLNPVDVFLDAEKLKKRTKRAILVELDEIGENQFKFSKISPKEYDPRDNLKYLYRSGSSRGTDITPSCLITEVERTFNNKFFKWFEQNANDDFLKAILKSLNDDKDLIYQEILTTFNGLDNSENSNVILTLVINSNDSTKFIGDYDVFRDILISKASEKYYKLGSKKIKGTGYCFLCDEEKEVFGLVSNSIGFGFSTPDKKGNVPEFNVENQWKQLPICGECALYLEAGKKFVEKYLSFKEFNLTYYVIPNFLFNKIESFDKLFKRIKRFEDKKNYDDMVLNEHKFNDIVNGFNDVLEFKFLFYNSSNSAFDILGYVESILPSWMNNIYSSQFLISSNSLFSEESLKKIINKETEGNLINNSNMPVSEFKWYLGFLKPFFPDFKKNNKIYLNKYYLTIVGNILNQKNLSYDFLISNFMNKIREDFRNGYVISFKLNVLRSLALLILFDNLKLFQGGKTLLEEDISLTDDVINSILNRPDKKACFLLGVLTRKLTYKQFKALNSSPFMDKLWGLSLDKKKIQKLFPRVLNKLREYDSAYIELEENISFNLLNAENNWKLTRDETSYYFTLGYTLAYAIDNNEDDIIEKNN